MWKKKYCSFTRLSYGCIISDKESGELDHMSVGETALVPMGMNALAMSGGAGNTSLAAITARKAPSMPKPKWHPPWKLFRVISGHLGWVRSVAVEPGNEWFATGSADRVIKVCLISLPI